MSKQKTKADASRTRRDAVPAQNREMCALYYAEHLAHRADILYAKSIRVSSGAPHKHPHKTMTAFKNAADAYEVAADAFEEVGNKKYWRQSRTAARSLRKMQHWIARVFLKDET